MYGFVPFLLDAVIKPSDGSGAATGGAASGGGLFSSSNPVMIIVVYPRYTVSRWSLSCTSFR